MYSKRLVSLDLLKRRRFLPAPSVIPFAAISSLLPSACDSSNLCGKPSGVTSLVFSSTGSLGYFYTGETMTSSHNSGGSSTGHSTDLASNDRALSITKARPPAASATHPEVVSSRRRNHVMYEILGLQRQLEVFRSDFAVSRSLDLIDKAHAVHCPSQGRHASTNKVFGSIESVAHRNTSPKGRSIRVGVVPMDQIYIFSLVSQISRHCCCIACILLRLLDRFVYSFSSFSLLARLNKPHHVA